jgi:hypothetical protein
LCGTSSAGFGFKPFLTNNNSFVAWPAFRSCASFEDSEMAPTVDKKRNEIEAHEDATQQGSAIPNWPVTCGVT